MTMGKVDLNDLLIMPGFLLAVLLNLQLIDDPTQGLLSSEIWAHSSTATSFSVATLLGLLSLGIVLYTNDFSFGIAGTLTIWAVIVTVGLMLAPPFVPIVSAILTSTAASYVAFALQALGYVEVSYHG